jgi:hypothetical protein
VKREDTFRPAFHGCIDWHSAVHGTWALLALSRLTKDPKYAAAADQVLDPKLLAWELQDLRDNALPEEIPYGYAWFLVLARERAKTQRTDLVPLASVVANDLDFWISSMSAAGFDRDVHSPAYPNLSWAALNLWRHAVDTGDTARAARMVTYARTKLRTADATCPLSNDADVEGFFPPCLHRAMALSLMLPAAEQKGWLDVFVPKDLTIVPVAQPALAHEAGLNFSRSWGLFTLYKATGNAKYGELYLDHMEPWLARPDIWAGDYQSYSHWVAQFGVYALALTYD